VNLPPPPEALPDEAEMERLWLSPPDMENEFIGPTLT